MKEKEQTKSYWRQHWCLIVYIILAVIGILVPTWAYLQPCEDEVSSYTQPADVFVLIDASKSLNSKSWKGEKDAAVQLLTQLNTSESVKDLQVGFLTFTGHWEGKIEHKYPVLRNVTNLGTDIDNVTHRIGTLGDKSYLQYGTNFHEPLSECKSQLEDYGREDSYKLCVLMTDGEDMSFTYHGHYGSCARGCSYPLQTASEVRNFSDTEILAVYSGRKTRGRDTLYNMSSCRDYDMPVDDCMYFTQVDDFPDLHAKLDNITNKIIDEINYTHVKCVKGPWLGFLLLLIPLVVMLMLPHCLRCCGAMKTVKKVRIINDAPKVPPPPPPTYNAGAEQAPPSAPVEQKIKKAYKWEVDLGSYVRTGGNIKPDWGKNGYVPKSAPTEGERRKRTVDDHEQADGYEYEYVEVEQTLEEWAEETMSGAANRFCSACYWFWCCCGMCCCYKKEEEEDAMGIKLLTPADALSDYE